MSNKMKIGIFGGTFSPIHNGHLNIAKNVKKKLDLDVVFIIPTYKTPDKKFSVENITPKDRYKMTKIAVKEMNEKWLKVSSYEFKKKEISLTYKTINHFKNKFPKDEIYFIMGEDRYFGLNKWEKYEEIMSNARIVVYRRSEKINKRIGNEVIYLKDNYYDISSTNILTNFEWEDIPDSVKKYISSNNLYLKKITFNSLKEKRYEHSIAVASHARRLAEKHGYKNKQKAYLSGMVHDLFKLHNKDFLKSFYKENDPNYDETIPNEALHGFVCSLWLENEYKLNDKEILNAIKNHTLGINNPSKLEKILFVADKISSDRKGDEIGKIRKLAYVDLDQTYNKLIKMLIKKLKKNNIKPHENTLNIYNDIIGKKKNESNLKRNKNKN